jgi:hypothetical protein
MSTDHLQFYVNFYAAQSQWKWYAFCCRVSILDLCAHHDPFDADDPHFDLIVGEEMVEDILGLSPDFRRWVI